MTEKPLSLFGCLMRVVGGLAILLGIGVAFVVGLLVVIAIFEPNADTTTRLRREVTDCEVLVLVIGHHPTFDDPQNLVRMAIGTGLDDLWHGHARLAGPFDDEFPSYLLPETADEYFGALL